MPFGERFAVSFRSRTPKPDAQKTAAVGLFVPEMAEKFGLEHEPLK